MFNLTIEEMRLVLNIISIFITVILVVATYLIWRKQQKLIRESHSSQNAILSQIALRMKVGIRCQILLNEILIKGVNEKKNILNTIFSSRGIFEDMYIDLIQRLRICQMYWGDDVKSIIHGYDQCYRDILILLNHMQSENTLSSNSISEEKKMLSNIVNTMTELENHSDVLKSHLL